MAARVCGVDPILNVNPLMLYVYSHFFWIKLRILMIRLIYFVRNATFNWNKHENNCVFSKV